MKLTTEPSSQTVRLASEMGTYRELKETKTLVFSSRGDWIRTSDLYVPNATFAEQTATIENQQAAT
jgi:hypothetical protein